MVLILDKKMTKRTIKLREEILQMHIPVAVSTIRKGRELFPAFCVVSFSDCVDEVSRAPYGDVPILIFGDGFVNRALGMTQLKTHDDLLLHVQNCVQEKMQKRGAVRCGNLGWCMPNGFLVTSVDIFFRGTPLRLSLREYAVMQYLIYADDACMSVYHIWNYAFSCRAAFSRNAVHAQISNINAKTALYTGHCLIAANRKKNGYHIKPHAPRIRKLFSKSFVVMRKKAEHAADNA